MMPVSIDALSRWTASVLVLSLRIAPMFAFAPPFTLIRVPAMVRVLLGTGIAAILLGSDQGNLLNNLSASSLVRAAALELLIGLTFVLALQVAFGALYLAGRTIDIQAGFGLASLIDPTSRAQTPLIGTLFAYAAGGVFFALDGHLDVLQILAASIQAMPIGAEHAPHGTAPLLAFMSASLVLTVGIAAASILTMFLVDSAIALLSRTAPQMNVLVLGFQVKTLVLLMVLPVSFGASGVLFVRLMRLTLDAMPRLI